MQQGAPGPGAPGAPPRPPPTPEQLARHQRVVQLIPRIMQHYRQLGFPPGVPPGWGLQLRQLLVVYARTGGDLDQLEKQVFTDNVAAKPLFDQLTQQLQNKPLYRRMMGGGMGGGPRPPGAGAPGARPGMGPGMGGGPPAPPASSTGGGAPPSGSSPAPGGAAETCPYCDSPVPAGASKCPSCTAPL